MKYLLETSETYRVSSEDEVTELIENAKDSKYYTLKKHSSQYKENKKTGEEWWKVTLVKSFTNEKDPEGTTEVVYTEGSAF